MSRNTFLQRIITAPGEKGNRRDQFLTIALREAELSISTSGFHLGAAATAAGSNRGVFCCPLAVD